MTEVWCKTRMNGQVFYLGFLELKGSHFQEDNAWWLPIKLETPGPPP